MVQCEAAAAMEAGRNRSDGMARLLPREDWKPYMAAVLRTPVVMGRWGSERKTGRPPAQRPARFLAREDCRLRVLRAA
jgi:hypothetical protein